jgi:multidrug resistance efflux pump
VPGEIIESQDSAQRQDEPVRTAEPIDPRQKALALGLEFSKRAVESESLEDLFFILTNDIRALVEFDRAFLVTHAGGKTVFSAASNQPTLEKKSKFHRTILQLGKSVKDLNRGLLLSAQSDSMNLPDEDIDASVLAELDSYLDVSECEYLFCVPLNHRGSPLGHLFLEFHERKPPNRVQILTVLNMAPFFAAALAEQWLVANRPGLVKEISPKGTTGRKALRFLFVTLPILLAVVGLIGFAFLFVPMEYYVGGESEVVPKERHIAFSKIDGIVEKVLVSEGQSVEKDQVLAILDKKELDYEIGSAQRQFDILTKEMVMLRRESGQTPAKLAESKLVELKRQSAWEQLQFLKWRARFLEIKAPVAGIVITKDVESLAGRKFKAGESFCEIAEPGELWVDVFVPEDKISFVADGQVIELYLNSNPREAYMLVVSETAPISEVVPRLGNVYRVSAPFKNAPGFVKVGMKGVGKIATGEANLWFIVSERLLIRWNQLSLYF